MPSTASRVDPFLGFRFEVAFTGLPAGGFSDCGGLQGEIEVLAYPEGGRNDAMRRFPTRTRHPNLVLRRGIVDRSLWDWFDAVVQGTITRRSGRVSLRDAAGDEVVAEWELRAAFPCRWTGPELNAAQSAVAVEALELCHEGLTRQV